MNNPEPILWYAPFTHTEVTILSGCQESEVPPPYRCSNDNSHPPLWVSINSLDCMECGYTQNWAFATEDPYGIAGLQGKKLIDKMMSSRWYVMVDDLIGGWCIMPVPLNPSSGYPSVGDFISEMLAQHIVELHNMNLHLENRDYV